MYDASADKIEKTWLKIYGKSNEKITETNDYYYTNKNDNIT